MSRTEDCAKQGLRRPLDIAIDKQVECLYANEENSTNFYINFTHTGL